MICAYFSLDSVEMTISLLEKAVIWIKDLKHLTDGFASYKHGFLRHKIDGLELCGCIIMMFLSTVWTLILTAPIHYIESIGEQVM